MEDKRTSLILVLTCKSTATIPRRVPLCFSTGCPRWFWVFAPTAPVRRSSRGTRCSSGLDRSKFETDLANPVSVPWIEPDVPFPNGYSCEIKQAERYGNRMQGKTDGGHWVISERSVCKANPSAKDEAWGGARQLYPALSNRYSWTPAFSNGCRACHLFYCRC